MRNDPSRSRHASDADEPDQWLLDAARRSGHSLPSRERPPGTSAWRILLSAGVADDEVLRIACAASGADPADFSQLSPALGDLLPHTAALKHRVAPLGVHRGTISVATSNPRNAELERELAFAARQRIRLCAASPADVIRAQGIVYGTVYGTKGGDAATVTIPLSPPAAPAAPSVIQPRPAPIARLSLQSAAPTQEEMDAADRDDMMVGAPGDAELTPAPDPAPEAPRPPAPDLADRLLATACGERASEAILEPTSDGGILVRLCVDGTLNDRFRVPAVPAGRLAQTLRERAHIDDGGSARQGRLTFEGSDGPVAVRVSAEETESGAERLVLRLRSAAALLGIDELGYAAAEQQRLRDLVEMPTGLLVVAGPAGAGKTTTLYAIARAIREQGRVVSTVEELIEYPLDDVAQTQLSGAARASVASAVRGLLGEPGDVIVGAALDTATIELCGTPTGRTRLTVASLDTEDLASTLERLLQLSTDRPRLAAVLDGIVVQRLVRRLCRCATVQPVEELPELQQRLLDGLPVAQVRSPVGCDECRTTGYLGRIALAEVVVSSPEFRKGITRGVAPSELARMALKGAKRTLWQSGLVRVLEGVTSLAELLDAVHSPADAGTGPPQGDIDSLLTQLLGAPAPKAEGRDPVAESLAASFTLIGDAPPVPPSPAAAVEPAPAPAARTRGALRVLLVDDDAAVRRALAEQLTSAGFKVLQAADGAAALTYARRLHPDVVLTEVALPGLDAIGLLAALATDERRPPVVVHTEQADDALDAWLTESGACAVLRRDMPMDDLAARLRAEVERGAPA